MDSRLLATIIIFPIWLTLVLVFRRHRQWLFYYLIAAFGLTLQLVFLAEHFGLDQTLVNLASFHVNLISKNIFHIPMELMSNGRFQLLLSDSSSSILKLGIECSAILESSIIFSLIIFYPLFNSSQKILRAVFGLVITYVINICRLMIIVLMAHKFGPDYIFLAHAGVARVFFFLFELLLYWYLMTKPSVKTVGLAIKEGTSLAEAAKIGHAFQLRHAYGQLAVVILVIGLSLGSFKMSDEWQKAFVPIARQERPIIYQDETSLESSSKEILGAESQVFDQLKIDNLSGQEEYIYRFDVTDFSLLNAYLVEGSQPIMVEVFLNEKFQDRSIIGATGEPILKRFFFSEPLKVSGSDIVELRFRNLKEVPSNYQIEIYTNGAKNEQ